MFFLVHHQLLRSCYHTKYQFNQIYINQEQDFQESYICVCLFLEFLKQKRTFTNKVSIKIKSFNKLAIYEYEGKIKNQKEIIFFEKLQILDNYKVIIYIAQNALRDKKMTQNLNNLMNFGYPKSEFQTPQKPIYHRSQHKHNSSQPLLGQYFRDVQEPKMSLCKVGEESLKKWDFFSDPFSLPEKYLISPQNKMKTETTDMGFDSIDFMLGKLTDRYSSSSLQLLHQKTQSEKIIGKKVQFSEIVQVKNDDGSESEEPMSKLSRQKARKSKFSMKSQRSIIQD
ncbi:unnamed protein product [Paramecium sonneborni]|uniref:Uncharacterized protein n=1 Tax=Paramecium sonneborni TaxID=65129 RepID=A0A8S1MSF0_9CILI|nr:unnamed protein product [Paramecium sonneborni]